MSRAARKAEADRPHPKTAEGWSLVLTLAAHFRVQGEPFTVALAKAEAFMVPWWGEDPAETADQFRAALKAAFEA